jgi:hypothetical protein
MATEPSPRNPFLYLALVAISLTLTVCSLWGAALVMIWLTKYVL